jgi:hypothetical protein
MKGSLRIVVSMAVLAICAALLQPAARAQAGFYLRFGGPAAGVAVGIPPCPGPGYFWVNGYYDGPSWIPGYWAWRGDDDGGYYGFRGGDDGGYYGFRGGDDGGYYGFRGGDDGGYWYRGGDGRDGGYGGFRGDRGYGRDGGRFYGGDRGRERH